MVRAVKLYVSLAVLEGATSSALDDEGFVREALERAVEAGGFSLRGLVVSRFEPHGVTGTAVVGESHVSIHTWPEEQRAFVDVASCSTREQVGRAIEAIADHLSARVTVLDERNVSSDGAEAAGPRAREQRS